MPDLGVCFGDPNSCPPPRPTRSPSPMRAATRHRRFLPGWEALDRRDLPGGLGVGVGAVAWGLYELYRSSPIKAGRSVALGGKLVRLAWTGKAKFAFGLIR